MKPLYSEHNSLPWFCWLCLLDSSPTNQLAVSQVADTVFFTLNLNLTLAQTLSTIESVQLCNLPQLTFIAIFYCKF